MDGLPDDSPFDEEAALLSSLRAHPGFAVLQKRIDEAKTRYYANLAHKLGDQPKPIDQRLIDEKRGFWLGATWFLREIERGHRAFVKEQEEVSPSG